MPFMQDVAMAGHSADVDRTAWVRLDLGPQVLYVPADQAGVRCSKRVAPHLFQQLSSGKEFTRVNHQVMEELELDGGKLHRIPSHAHLVRVQIQGERAHIQYVRAFRPEVSARGRAASA